MIYKTAIGALNTNQPRSNFNEVNEIKLRKILMKCLDEEKRTDGEVAFVVKDLGQLVETIMKYYEKQ